MSYKLPNFLIVGAAKCGTSSLYQYVAQHPEIYMSKHKEPRFISSQCMNFPMNGPKDAAVEKWYIKDYDQYKELFKEVGNEKIIGEASADTLYFHKCSIPIIKKYINTDPKILIILRDPVKRAFSAYQHMIRDGREKLSFEEALSKEEERIRDNWELIYHYTQVSKYSEQVKDFFDNFSKVKVIFNEELSRSPRVVLREIFNFLEVDPDCEIKTDKIYNESGKPKNRYLHNFLFFENNLKKYMRPALHLFTTKQSREKMQSYLLSSNLERIEIEKTIQEKLQIIFKDEKANLEKLLNQKIDFWL